MTNSVLFLDVDRTLLPIHDTSAWPDYTTISSPYGDVPMSPRLLSAVGALPTRIVYVTDWGADAQLLDRHLGRTDTEVADRVNGDGWWKTHAIAAYLNTHPSVTAVVHADDHLTDERTADLTRIAAGRPLLTVTPVDGLTPTGIRAIQEFLTTL